MIAEFPDGSRQRVLAKAGLCEVCLKLGLGTGPLERHVGLYSKPMIILDFLAESFMPLQGA
jgi:hypothetical protein